MVLSRRIARFNKVVTHRVTGLWIRRLPGWGVVHHRGRTSGRAFETQVNVFRRPGGYVIALTYGPGADWVKNVLAAGECDIVSRHRRIHLVHPRVVHDPARTHMPPAVRTILSLTGVTDFLYLDEVPAPASG